MLTVRQYAKMNWERLGCEVDWLAQAGFCSDFPAKMDKTDAFLEIFQLEEDWQFHWVWH